MRQIRTSTNFAHRRSGLATRMTLTRVSQGRLGECYMEMRLLLLSIYTEVLDCYWSVFTWYTLQATLQHSVLDVNRNTASMKNSITARYFLFSLLCDYFILMKISKALKSLLKQMMNYRPTSV
jgi:hypothetical protein